MKISKNVKRFFRQGCCPDLEILVDQYRTMVLEFLNEYPTPTTILPRKKAAISRFMQTGKCSLPLLSKLIAEIDCYINKGKEYQPKPLGRPSNV